MKIYPLAVVFMLTGLLGAAAQAGDRGTPDEAKAMAIKAAQYLLQVGPETAFPAFSAKDGSWHDRDLYVYVLDKDSKVLAHGGMPALIGRSIVSLKDVDGNSIAEQIRAVSGSGWAEYKWQNPVTKALEPKKSYVVPVGDDRVVVGAYK